MVWSGPNLQVIPISHHHQQRANPGRLTTRMAEAAVGEPAFVPDMDRRQLMNSILLGSVGLSVLGLAVPYLSFFVPPSGSGA